jgi:DNA polymerase-3 subunit alpha
MRAQARTASRTSIALVALYRPGPLESGMVETSRAQARPRGAVRLPASALEPILKDTYGVILYQEQVMQIAQVLGRLLARRCRPAAPRDGQEKGRGDGQAARIFRAGAAPTASTRRWPTRSST